MAYHGRGVQATMGACRAKHVGGYGHSEGDRARNPDAIRHECADCGATTKVSRTGRSSC